MSDLKMPVAKIVDMTIPVTVQGGDLAIRNALTVDLTVPVSYTFDLEVT